MPSTDDTDPGQRDQPPTDEAARSDDEAMVVFECSVPTEAFVLEKALREFPDVIVEQERLVPTNHDPMPYLWTTDGQTPQFRDAIAADPKVERVSHKATFEEGGLYSLEWAPSDGDLFHRIANTHEETALLQAEGHDERWTLKLRFSSRAHLTDFRAFCDEQDIDLRIIHIYDLTEPKLGEYNITEKQREALIRALEMGHFEIPREATLEEVADSLGVSSKSLSERLRRGQTNLVSNTLTIGQPTGVRLEEQ